MSITQDQAKFIHKVNSAAISDTTGVIDELLRLLDESIALDGSGNREVIAERQDGEKIIAAQIAWALVKEGRSQG